MKRILFGSGLIVLLVSSACAPAVPTIDPAQIQASAVAAASTMIAMTKAAMPTPTEVPPTELPSPTFLPTLAELPTLPGLLPTETPSTNTADSCNHLLDIGATTHDMAKLLIKNNTNGPVTLTIGKSKKDAFGQCGYMSWSNIPKKSSITVSVPQTGPGPCYWFYAWVNDPKQQRTLSPGGLYCMNNPDKWTMNIGYDTISLTPP